ncbi:MAG: TetR/AcrR family transcriptional regulator [Eubacteriales bacterium]
MDKFKSKYFNTAALMDEALILLLEKKDYEYITVKDICEKAGVNRSTFYLHYETKEDLLRESMRYIQDKFLEKFDRKSMLSEIGSLHLEKLVFIKPEYIEPYLTFIKENKRIFRAVVNNASTMNLEEVYEKMFTEIFNPIMERFKIPASERKYYVSFYLHGLIAVVNEWLKDDCKDSVEHITELCIRLSNIPN